MSKLRFKVSLYRDDEITSKYYGSFEIEGREFSYLLWLGFPLGRSSPTKDPRLSIYLGVKDRDGRLLETGNRTGDLLTSYLVQTVCRVFLNRPEEEQEETEQDSGQEVALESEDDETPVQIEGKIDETPEITELLRRYPVR